MAWAANQCRANVGCVDSSPYWGWRHLRGNPGRCSVAAPAGWWREGGSSARSGHGVGVAVGLGPLGSRVHRGRHPQAVRERRRPGHGRARRTPRPPAPARRSPRPSPRAVRRTRPHLHRRPRRPSQTLWTWSFPTPTPHSWRRARPRRHRCRPPLSRDLRPHHHKCGPPHRLALSVRSLTVQMSLRPREHSAMHRYGRLSPCVFTTI